MKWLIGVLVGIILLLFAALMYSLGQNVAPMPEPTPTPSARPRPTPTPSESPIPLPVPTPTAEPTPAPGRIPTAFQGFWNMNPVECDEEGDDSMLRVGPQRLRFYEAEAEVRGILIKSEREIVVQLAYSGEGDTWMQNNRMTLSPDGKRLSIDGFERLRCGTGEAL